MTMKQASIREMLISTGVPEAKIYHVIRYGILAWHSRVADRSRVLIGGNRLTAEFCLIEDIANCASSADIEEAFFYYYNDPSRINHWCSRLLGIVPRQSRTMKFYNRIKSLANQHGPHLVERSACST